MTIDTLHFENGNWVLQGAKECSAEEVDIVFVFGTLESISDHDHHALLKQRYRNADIVGASTAGNILDDGISEYEAVAAAVHFEKGHVFVRYAEADDTHFESVKKQLQGLPKEGLRHVFALTGGLEVNGSELVKTLNKELDVSVTGGLAGDDLKFERTLVFANELKQDNMAVFIGLYGDSLHVDIGCKAGWEEFGAERIITRSEGNVVYEIDNKPALDLYKAYLKDYIKDLPFSGLLFPLNVREYEGEHEVIRVMMGINEDESIVFAGDVPQGSVVRLMKTSMDNLIDGSALVANTIVPRNDKRSLTLSISCSGRRSVLKHLVDEEIDIIAEVLGENNQIIGFYSYGELAPFSDDVLNCKLHNQTMTLTVLYED